MEKEAVENVRKAGEIHKKLVEFARGFIRPGMKLIDIASKIDDKIVELGARPAFPVNLCIDEVAAHSTPCLSSEETARGLLKVDIGVQVDGYVADGAFSLDLENDETNRKLIEAAEAGLNAALGKVGIGVTLGEIGESVQSKINSFGFVPIKNLTGHEIERYDLHAGLNVPNYASGQEEKLSEGLFAIEPFATNGLGRVRDGKPSGIYRLQTDGNVRDSFARDVLNFIIEEYQSLPFCSRWVVKKFGSRGLLALHMIEQAGILHQYPQLVEEGKGKVAQAEHTVLLLGEGEKIVTTLSSVKK